MYQYLRLFSGTLALPEKCRPIADPFHSNHEIGSKFSSMLFRVTLIVALFGIALCEDSPANLVLNQFRARNKAALVAHVDEGMV